MYPAKRGTRYFKVLWEVPCNFVYRQWLWVSAVLLSKSKLGLTMHRVRNFFVFLLALAILGSVVGALIYAVLEFFSYIGSVPKELGAALVAGASTILVATITVMVGRYYERKKELDTLYRDKKTEVYDEFLKVFFQVWFSGGKAAENEELVNLFRDFSVKLVLWSGPEALEAFARWKEKMAEGNLNAEALFETEAFLNAVRSDLRHSNHGIRRGWFARLFLQESGVFLALAAKNPKVSLAELSAAEKLARELKGRK